MDTFPDMHEDVSIAHPELGRSQLQFESHNLWLGTLLELGVPGLVLIAVLVAAALTQTLSGSNGPMQVFAGLVGVLVANMFIANLEFKYFWLALALASIQRDRGVLETLPSTRASLGPVQKAGSSNNNLRGVVATRLFAHGG